MLQHVIDNIWIGDWQEASHHWREFDKIFTVAKDSPFMGDYYYPMIDGPYSENQRLLYRAIFDLFAYRSKNNGNVLVHCVSGFSRSTTVIAGYMIKKGFVHTVEDSLEYIKSIRPSANPVPSLVELLKKYERRTQK